MLTWNFTIPFRNKYITLHAELIYNSDQVERVKISYMHRHIVIENNRPLLIATGSGKKISWKFKEGNMPEPLVLNRIFHDVEYHLIHHNDKPYIHPKNS